MTIRPEHIVRLTSAPTEMEAGVIVAALEQNGIKATLVGQSTSGFRAEAPGWVHVLVAEEDMSSAQSVLDEVRREDEDIDWSRVDYGQSEEDKEADARPWLASFAFWRRVAQVIVVVGLVVYLARLLAYLVGLLARTAGLWPEA